MSGNVREWCNDFAYNQSPYPYGNHVDPQGVASGGLQIIRGGSWSSGAAFCMVTKEVRDLLYPQLKSDDIGFRLAFNLVR